MSEPPTPKQDTSSLAKTKKACFIPNSNIKSLAEETQKNVKPGRNQQSHPSWVESPSPTRTGLSYRSHMAGRAPNEWRSRLFKPCFSTCSSGALHFLNWPGPGCHKLCRSRYILLSHDFTSSQSAISQVILTPAL